MRHFLTLSDLTREEITWVLSRGRGLKNARSVATRIETLRGKTLGLVFEKPSTRTRVSFEAGMAQLGGHAMVLPQSESQMSRGEPLKDTARVLSGYLDAIVMRTHSHERVTEMARYSRVPVINGLTESAHPCQLLADLMTVIERFSTLEGRVVAFVGDGATNMALSWMEAASIFGFELRVAAPAAYQAKSPELRGRVLVTTDPKEAVKGAHVVNTDVWTSMGQESEAQKRRDAFSGFIVDEALMKHAHPEAIVLHCLPAHRGEEISEGVLEGPQSAVWQQAENRMHAQKALLELLLLPERPTEQGA
jgi:ornithine carbamoyltransferase